MLIFRRVRGANKPEDIQFPAYVHASARRIRTRQNDLPGRTPVHPPWPLPGSINSTHRYGQNHSGPTMMQPRVRQ
jgi:hypothetical protein